MFKELFTEASKYKWEGGSDSYSDARKIEELISDFDFYSHMIDDYKKQQRVESENRYIKDELKKLGVTSISFKDGSEKREIK